MHLDLNNIQVKMVEIKAPITLYSNRDHVHRSARQPFPAEDDGQVDIRANRLVHQHSMPVTMNEDSESEHLD